MKTLVKLTLTLLITPLSFITPSQIQAMSASNTEIKFTDNLIEAVSTIDLVGLNVLLADGANIDTVDQKGNTPLMIAAKIGNPRMVTILLAHNPDVNRKNSEGNTALMIASEHGQTFVVRQLIAKGADLNVKNISGFTSLEIARRNGHVSIIDLLRNKTKLPLSR